MLEKSERERLIRKMFILGLKETFSPFYRKYEEQIVVEVWAEIMTNGGLNGYPNRWMWKPDMTITEAFNSLDFYRDSIEAMIQQRQEQKK